MTILHNVLRFTGLVIGVPASLPHRLNDNEVPVAPQVVLPRSGGFLVAADAMTVTVTRTAAGAPDVDIYVEHWHSLEDATPPGALAGLVPFVLSPTGGLGPSADPAIVFVFRPGGIAGANVYTTWASLVAALGLVQGSKVILFDDTILPCVIPAGAYDMTDTAWAGLLYRQSDVSVSEGASFLKLRQFQDALTVTFTGATPPVSDFGPGESVLIWKGAEITCSGTGAFFSNTLLATDVAFILIFAGRFLSGANAVLDMPAAGATSVVAALGALAEIALGTISGVVGSVFILGIGASGVIVTEVQPAFAGILFPINLTKARLNPTTTQVGAFVAVQNDVVRCDPSAGGFTVTLPLAFDVRGMWIIVKNVSGSANVITISPSGADTIDGAASAMIAAARGVLRFVSDGVSDWMIV